jgi:hypothetical protein
MTNDNAFLQLFLFFKVVDKVARGQFTVSSLWFYSNATQPLSFHLTSTSAKSRVRPD